MIAAVVLLPKIHARRSLTLSLCLLLYASAPALAADQYKVDVVHSSVVFRIKHLDVSYCYGRFNRMSGTFQLDASDPSRSAIDVQVEADSVDTANAQRDQALRGSDFFDVQKLPMIRFESKKVSRNDAGIFLVEGEMTLHGVTRPLTIQVESTGTGKGMFGEVRSGLEAVFTLRRSEFGMNKMLGSVGDEVRLIVSLEGIRQ